VNRRAFTAVVRLELLRGRRLLLWGTGAAVLALLGALLLPRGGALFMGVIGLPLVMIIGMAPLGTLASDKLLGHLEFDRTLPVSLRTIAAGRLMDAALRSLPAMLGVMALGVAIANVVSRATNLRQRPNLTPIPRRTLFHDRRGTRRSL